MKASSALLKQEFLKKWIKGLHLCRDLNKDMNVLDRKKAIKLSAEVAIASTRNARTHWSKALMANVVSRNDTNKIIVEKILGQKVEKRASTGLITCGKRILRGSRIVLRKARGVVPQCVKSSKIAKKWVMNRTRLLKKLVPGGEEMDEVSLFQETLDYILTLRVQVDVMRRVASAAERMSPSRKHLCN